LKQKKKKFLIIKKKDKRYKTVLNGFSEGKELQSHEALQTA